MKIKFELLSRAITENSKYFINDIFLLPTNYFHQSSKKKNPITRVIDWNTQWRSIKAAKSYLMKSYRGRMKTAINLKWNLNLIKKVFSAKESRRLYARVDIIVRKLSLSIFRRVIVRVTEARSPRSHPGALRTTIIFTLQPHKSGREIVGSRN